VSTCIRLVFFARLRERFGRSEERLMLSPEVITVGDLLTYLRGRDDVGAMELAAGRPFGVAVNHQQVQPSEFERRLRDGDEVAIFPPVTGG